MDAILRAITIAQRDGIQSLVQSTNRAFFNKVAYCYGTTLRPKFGYIFQNIPSSPYQLLYVDPALISAMVGPFNPNPSRYGGFHSRSYYKGTVAKDGDWDLDRTSINELPKYQAVKKRYSEGIPWEETGIYDHILEKIENGGSYDKCHNKSDIIKRYKKIDELYNSIKSNGYCADEGGTLDQVCVNIGRDGEILFNGNGQHRLAIAKHLNLEEIPVRVLVQHKKWIDKNRR